MLGNFRELTAAEIDFVYGGDGEEIVVTYISPGGGFGNGGGGSWGRGSDTDQNGNNNGSGDPGNVTSGCSTETEAAAHIANMIKTATSKVGSETFNWTQVEFGATVVRSANGLFNTGNSGAIYGNSLVNEVNIADPILGSGDSFAGIIHNHPDLEGNREEDLENRYPSANDFDQLAKAALKFGASNPSIWILDKFGDVREFKLSDRNNIERLSFDQKISGMRLPSAIAQSGTSC